MRYLFLFGLVFLSACSVLDDPTPTPFYATTPVPAPDARGGKPLVIVLGDSIAAGWQACRPTACSGVELDWWQAAIGADAPGQPALVLNRGVGSSTTGDLLERWEADTDGQPDMVIIISGVNDVARGVPAETILANFERMHRRATEAGIVPIFSTIMPADTTPAAGIEAMNAVNVALRERAAAGAWWVIDLSAEMESEQPGRLRRDEVAFEGSSHPNAAGYARMSAYVAAWWAEHQTQLEAARGAAQERQTDG